MCSLFEMENTGDLTDIIRASGGIFGCGEEADSSNTNPSSNWQFSSETMNFSSDSAEMFGDPFSSSRDPLRHLHDSSGVITAVGGGDSGGFPGVFPGDSLILPQRIFRDEIRTPRNIFSRGPQISPNTKLPLTSCDPPLMVNSSNSTKSSSVVSNEIINPIGLNNCLVDNSIVQISSPRNSGIKRRKSQAKKVVCIPAPTPANSRPSGEVVPSDLWAWRKYGQKPIKGSPYPRGYYRCSSSKGCSARKQVERSRTDPNMLVITYTSEHNHPWPTQRNALAGSTRSQPLRNSSHGDVSKPSNGGQGQKTTSPKEEEDEEDQMKDNELLSGFYVKEEMEEIDQIKELAMEDEDQFMEAFAGCSSEDFFADLGEIQTDSSLNLIFSEALSGNKQKDGKNLEHPVPLFDWPGIISNPNSSSFHQQKKDS